MSNNHPDLTPNADSDLRPVHVSTYRGRNETCLQLAQGPGWDTDVIHLDQDQIAALHARLGQMMMDNVQKRMNQNTGRSVRRNPVASQ